MNLDPLNLFFSFLFSSIGFGFFLYGKKQSRMVPLVCGIALFIYPYFISNRWLLVGIGLGLSLIPYFFRD